VILGPGQRVRRIRVGRRIPRQPSVGTTERGSSRCYAMIRCRALATAHAVTMAVTMPAER
jgi:hypothetical protein